MPTNRPSDHVPTPPPAPSDPNVWHHEPPAATDHDNDLPPMQPTTTPPARIARPSFFTRQPRTCRRLLFTIFWFGPLVFGVVMTLNVLRAGADSGRPEQALSAVCFLVFALLCGKAWLWIGHWPAHWLSSSFMASLVSTAQCPHCHDTHQLVDRWTCACGYVDHCERHLYLFRCPQCRRHLDRTSCPRCDATILL